MIRKIAIAVGSRADYGHLAPLLKKIIADKELQLRLAMISVSFPKKPSQLRPFLEQDGLSIDHEIALSLRNDSSTEIARCVGLVTERFAAWLARSKPDLLIVLGDRYEILACAQAALFVKVPLAHLGGGDITEGAFDESIRHAVTKLAQLHFVTNESAALRICHMGEDPRHVFNVGSLVLDQIRQTQMLDRGALEQKLRFRLKRRNLLITFHPPTLSAKPASEQFMELLKALASLGKDYGLIFTHPNADPGGMTLLRQLRRFVKKHPNAKAYSTMGHTLYFSLMRQVDAVVGNSSSGVYEAPSFKKPSIDIGDRQKGRLTASSVICCAPERRAILQAIKTAAEMDCSRAANPYGDGHAAGRIVETIKRIRDPKALLRKYFFDKMQSSKHRFCCIVAEAGVNHNGSVVLAKKLIDAAVEAGADVVKFQTFKPERVVSIHAPKAEYQKERTGKAGSQLEMIRKLQLGEKEHKELLRYARKCGIEFLSAPFDEPSVDFLVQRLKLRRIKIPSGEITNAPLLLRVARGGLPVILSTGMSDLKEIEEALGALAFGYTHPAPAKPSRHAFRQAFASVSGRQALTSRVTLLQCTTEYPAPFAEANLRAMDTLRDLFQLPVGLSDHTAGIAVSVAAAARGAVMIEKHLTLRHDLPGPDHRASLEPGQFKNLVRSIRQVEAALGSFLKQPSPSEIKNKPIARKSLVALRRIRRGEILSAGNMTAKRPGTGLSPFDYWETLGHKAIRVFAKDELIVLERETK